MARLRKCIRENGKLKLSRYFKNFNDMERVGVVMDRGSLISFPRRLRGMSGEIIGSRGESKLIKIKDGSKLKTFIIHPVHLKGL